MNGKGLWTVILLFSSVVTGCIDIDMPGHHGGPWWYYNSNPCGYHSTPATSDIIIVSGAGTEACNGTYVRSGTVNGRPAYAKAGTAYGIEYDGEKGWCIRESCTLLYHCMVDAESPPTSDEYAWKTIYGDLPEPVVDEYYGMDGYGCN